MLWQRLILLLSILGLAACDRTVDVKQLQIRNDLAFAVNEQAPVAVETVTLASPTR